MLGRQLLATLVGLGLYGLGRVLPLPGVDYEADVPAEVLDRANPFETGLQGFIAGFILVELYSLLIPSGRRLRHGGAAGRARLNRVAFLIGLLLSAYPAVGIAVFLNDMVSPGGAPIVPDSGWVLTLATALTLLAGACACYVLGSLITAWGIANGFCLIFLFEALWPLSGWSSNFYREAPELVGPDPSALASLAAGMVLLVPLFMAERQGDLAAAFPQGILPVVWAVFLVELPLTLRGLIHGRTAVEAPDAPVVVLAMAALVPALSWMAFGLFSRPARLENNLPLSDADLADLSERLRSRLLPTTLALTFAAAWFYGGSANHQSALLWSLDLPVLAILAATALDAAEQARFTLRHGQGITLLTLDNVHLAHRLLSDLRERGLAAFVRARRFRSLFYFFSPLIKMDLVVPADQAETAARVVESYEIEVI